MAIQPPKDPIQAIALSGQLIDIVSNPIELVKLRIALCSWFMSYLTQTDDHVNHSPLSENIYFYEVLQEWLVIPDIEQNSSTSSNT